MYANQCFENSRSHISPFWSGWLTQTQLGSTKGTGSDSLLVSHQILVQGPWHCVALFHLCAWQGCGRFHFAPVAPWPGGPVIAYECTCNLVAAAWPQIREAETEPTEGRKRQCEAAAAFRLKTKLKHWKRTLCLDCSLLMQTRFPSTQWQKHKNINIVSNKLRVGLVCPGPTHLEPRCAQSDGFLIDNPRSAFGSGRVAHTSCISALLHSLIHF